MAEMRTLLLRLRERLEPMPVLTWMSQGAEHAAELGELIGLMLEVHIGLMKEVDAFVDSTVSEADAIGGASEVVDLGSDLFDLPDREVVPEESLASD